MHTRYVTQDGDKDILAPYIECDGKQQTLSVMIRRGKMSKSVIKDRHFTSFPELGDVVYAMLNEDPDRRPGMISVVSDIAELKGSLKVGHSYLNFFIKKIKCGKTKEGKKYQLLCYLF